MNTSRCVLTIPILTGTLLEAWKGGVSLRTALAQAPCTAHHFLLCPQTGQDADLLGKEPSTSPSRGCPLISSHQAVFVGWSFCRHFFLIWHTWKLVLITDFLPLSHLIIKISWEEGKESMKCQGKQQKLSRKARLGVGGTLMTGGLPGALPMLLRLGPQYSCVTAPASFLLSDLHSRALACLFLSGRTRPGETCEAGLWRVGDAPGPLSELLPRARP